MEPTGTTTTDAADGMMDLGSFLGVGSLASAPGWFAAIIATVYVIDKAYHWFKPREGGEGEGKGGRISEGAPVGVPAQGEPQAQVIQCLNRFAQVEARQATIEAEIVGLKASLDDLKNQTQSIDRNVRQHDTTLATIEAQTSTALARLDDLIKVFSKSGRREP